MRTGHYSVIGLLLLLAAPLAHADLSAMFLSILRVTSRFDVTRNTGANFSFSADHLTATDLNGAPPDFDFSAFTTNPKSDTRRYFRFTFTTASSSCGQGVGVASSTEVNGAYLGHGGGNSIGIFTDGSTSLNNASLGSTGLTFGQGDVVDLIIDPSVMTIQEVVNGGAPSPTISIATLSTQNVSPAVSLCAANDAVVYSGNPPTSYSGAIAWDAPTPGNVLTTFTFVNDTGTTLPAGTPVSMAQGFRYGDIMPGNYPQIRSASTHVPIAGQQWDEISTWRENGGNSSWRHAVWAIQLPVSLNAGATYQIEFIPVAGTYSQSSHQSLSALCSGVLANGAHDLQVHYTDVRNQDDSVRDSGDATFRVCDNIANTGRDAPRHLRAGNVYDEYEVSGIPVYTSGHKDPLLYTQCIVDLFTKASDGASLGDTRWVCHNHNSWENVAAGSTGNAGNPGPAGFTGDPQMVSYRAEVDDGATDVLDWSNLDATITSASNPIVSAGSVPCNSEFETYCLTVPGSTGNNTWYEGMATRVSSSGTPVGGLVNNGLYWAYPSGTAKSHSSANSQYVSLKVTPGDLLGGEVYPLTSSQGSGTTTFSTRITNWHFEAWQTLDYTGLPNWSPSGSATRVTRKIYPAFTAAEKLYWEQTGLVIPINTTQPTQNLLQYAAGLSTLYQPMGRLNVIGGTGTGSRPDLGIIGEFASNAFITQAQGDWDLARLFSYGTPVHGYSTMLDEGTGRLSAMNNGSPTGPGGSGSGTPYAGLGPLRNQIQWGGGFLGLADPNHTASPPTGQPGFDLAGGTMNYGTSLDHIPAFGGLTYMIFGDRHFLDFLQWDANRSFAQQRVGPGGTLGQGYYRDNNAIGPDSNTHHYWGLTTDCYQGRGCAWLTRNVLYPAVFGGDSNIERSLFADMMTETSNYWPLFLAARDGPGSTGYSGSIYPPGEPDAIDSGGVLMDTFVTAYMASVSYEMAAWLHLPMSTTWNGKLQRYYEGVCGRQLPNTVSSYYCIDFNIQPQIANGNASDPYPPGTNVGQYENGVDAADFGAWSAIGNVLAGGQFQGNRYTYTNGDTIKFIYSGWGRGQADPYAPIDQLPGTRWFTLMNVNQGASTYQLQCTAADHTAWPTQCPVANAAWVGGWTRGGVAISIPENNHAPKLRLQFDPGAGQGYADTNYARYGGQTINGLAVLGYSVPNAVADFASRCGMPGNTVGCYQPDGPSFWWDPTVVVPGLPTPVNGFSAAPLLPADRNAGANWKMAGLQSVGGIPNRTTQCGATITPIGGGSNDTTNIQNAINSCPAGQFVNLSAGTFTISEGSYLLLNKGITVRGAGAGNTILTRPAGPGSWSNQGACSTGGAWGATLGCSNPGNNPTPMFIVSPLARFNPNNVTGTTLTSDGAQGASSIQVSSTAGLSVGQIVLLDELSGASFVPDIEGRATSIFAAPDYRVTYHIHNPSCCNDDGTNVEDDYTVNHDRMTNEIKQISAINGNTVTFDSPLTISYRTSHTAELWHWATPFLQSAGIENMTLQHADDAQVEFDWCAYCWAQNVEQTLWLNEAFAINESFRTQLERDYIHDGAWCVPGGGGYNISMRYDSSEILIENSISIRCNKVMVSRASGAGSVVGYNYMDMGYIAGSCCWQEMGLNSSHLVGPHHTLFEGNWGFNGDGDATHGNSTNMTFYRNWLTGLRSTFVGEDGVTWNDSATHCTGGAPMRAVGPEAYHWWYSYIGNVLGSPCSTAGNGWSLNGSNQVNPAIFMLGWDDQTSGFTDPNVKTIYPAVGPNCSPSSPNCSTVMDGNYDYFRSQVTWASNDTAHTLPNSLYLSGTPAFFGPGTSCTYTWPWVTPAGGSPVLTNSCGNSGLPAKARFDAGTPFVQP